MKEVRGPKEDGLNLSMVFSGENGFGESYLKSCSMLLFHGPASLGCGFDDVAGFGYAETDATDDFMVDESVDLAHEIFNQAFRKVPEKLKK